MKIKYNQTDKEKSRKYYLMGLNLYEISKLLDIPYKTLEKWHQHFEWKKIKVGKSITIFHKGFKLERSAMFRDMFCVADKPHYILETLQTTKKTIKIMFQLIHYVEVADSKDSFVEIPFISEITIEKSTTNLADTAVITVPIFNFNNHIRIENAPDESKGKLYKLFKRGQRIRIFLGYHPTLRLEFVGYIKEVKTNDDVMKLECEDELFLFREKNIPNKTFTPGNVKQIVNHITKLVNPKIKVVCDYTMGYEKFTIIDATGYDVLKQIQEDTGADIYFKSKLSSQVGQTINVEDVNHSSQLSGKELQFNFDGSKVKPNTLELHISAPFIKKNTDVDCDFSFQHNIETSQLQYEDSKDNKVKVKITSVSINGVNVTEEFGSTGGTEKEIKVNRMSKASMKKRAKLEHEKLTRPHYSGSFDAWLVPFVEPNYSINIEDSDFPEKNGIYNVDSVTISYSEAGGKRTITPSFKLSGDSKKDKNKDKNQSDEK